MKEAVTVKIFGTGVPALGCSCRRGKGSAGTIQDMVKNLTRTLKSRFGEGVKVDFVDVTSSQVMK